MGIIRGFFRGVGKVSGKVIDVRADKWLGYEYLKATSMRTFDIVRENFLPEQATSSETFEEALHRLQLTESLLKQRIKEFQRLLWFHLALTAGVIGYALYMASQHALIATLVAFCLSIWCAGQAFRYHFWLFQMQHRKLGCTLSEWFNSEIKSRT